MKRTEPYLNDTYALATIPCYRSALASAGSVVGLIKNAAERHTSIESMKEQLMIADSLIHSQLKPQLHATT